MICDELYKEKQAKVAKENGKKVRFENDMDTMEIERRTQNMIEKINKVL